MSRLLIGILLFLGAFLLGLAAVIPFTPVCRYTAQIPDEEIKESNGCNNEDEISLLRWHDKPHPGSHVSLPRLGITNDGSNSAFFLSADLRIYPDSGAESIPIPPQNEVGSGVKNVLEPRHTIVFALPKDWDDTAGAIVFRYKVGEAKVWRSIRARFGTDQQLPDGCFMLQAK